MMHQASILFSFMVLVMGGVWLALVAFGGEAPVQSDPPSMMAYVEPTVSLAS